MALLPPVPHPYTAEGGPNEKVTLQVNGEHPCRLLWAGARWSANVEKELTVTYKSPLGGKYSIRAETVNSNGKKWVFWGVPFDFRITAADYFEIEAEAGGEGVTCTITAMAEPLQGADNLAFARVIQGDVTYVEDGIIGTIPPNVQVAEIEINVTTAFNSDGTNLLSIGHDDDHDAYALSINVGAVGPKVFSVAVAPESGARTVKAYYTAGGSPATAGKTQITVRYEA